MKSICHHKYRLHNTHLGMLYVFFCRLCDHRCMKDKQLFNAQSLGKL